MGRNHQQNPVNTIRNNSIQPALFVGVAGWSYADWNDTVYRLPAPPQRQLSLFAEAEFQPAAPSGPRCATDPLAFLARYVDMIEINSSFYRIPRPAAVEAWARKTAFNPAFFFTAKLHRDFTHAGSRDPALAHTFREAFAPLRDAGKLRGILAQFRYDVTDSPETRDHLCWLRDHFASLAPWIVEVRHVSWQREDALAFLRGLEATVAILDYPEGRNSFRITRNAGAPDAYFRLHGRNAAAWFAREKEPHEPYNHDYSDAELAEIGATARNVLPDVRSLTIVANNHYRGKAVSAALRLKSELLGQRVAVPPALLDTYPSLSRISRPDHNVEDYD